MAKSVLYMSMSLDGFITGLDDGPGNGLGNGGQVLHEWLGEPVSRLPHFDPPGLSGQVFAELMATRAVVVGRKTFDYAGHWGGDHQACRSSCPRAAPRRATERLGPLRARRRDRDARGQGGRRRPGRDGARRRPRAVVAARGAARRAGDHLIPVLLGDGRRLFGAGRVELELTRVLAAPGVTHLRYRVAT